MNIQDFIIEATKSISHEVLKRNKFTISQIGRVININSKSRVTIVEINGLEVKCILPINMARYVTHGDIVVVQDLHNNGAYMVIHGVIKGSGNNTGGGGNTIIHIYDTVSNTVVSSVMQVWNVATNSVVSATFKVEQGSES